MIPLDRVPEFSADSEESSWIFKYQRWGHPISNEKMPVAGWICDMFECDEMRFRGCAALARYLHVNRNTISSLFSKTHRLGKRFVEVAGKRVEDLRLHPNHRPTAFR